MTNPHLCGTAEDPHVNIKIYYFPLRKFEGCPVRTSAADPILGVQIFFCQGLMDRWPLAVSAAHVASE